MPFIGESNYHEDWLSWSPPPSLSTHTLFPPKNYFACFIFPVPLWNIISTNLMIQHLVTAPVQWLRFSILISMTWLQSLTRELKLWLQATEGQGPLRSRPLLYLASIWCYFNQLQCSCLENPRDGGAWWAAVYGVA